MTFAVPKPDCKALVDRLSQRTDEVKAVPVLREYLARAFHCDHRRDEALEQLRLAYKHRSQLIKDGQMKAADLATWFQSVSFVFPASSPGVLDASAAEQFVLELSNNSPTVREMQGLALLWLLSGDPKATRTIELFRQGIQQCPVSDKEAMVDLNMNLANVLLLTRDFEGATASYLAVLSLEPNNVNALNNLAFLTAQDMNDPTKALTYAEQALRLAPSEAPVLDTVGWVHYLAGNNDKARQYLLESVKLEPSNAVTRVHLAEALIKAGDFDGALKQLDETDKLRFDQTTRQKMDRLREEISKAQKPGG